MKILQLFSLKTARSAGLSLTLLGTMVGCTVVGPGYDNNSVYRGDKGYDNNASYNRVSQRLRQDLRRKGYQVIDIKSDNYRGNRAITAYAKKSNQTYELKYTYPSLKLISSNRQDWSKKRYDDKYDNDRDYDKHDYDKHDYDKKDKYRNKNKGNKNKNRYKNDDIEDSIKRESRYPAIKQRAVRKVSAMGYRVKDIELEEKNNRGVFEIEARRGSQDYEILLGYPNLNVIKVEKD